MGGRRTEFCKLLGWTPQYLAKLLRGDNFGLQPVLTILSTFPEINARWLLLGRRERRKSDKSDYESLFICRNTLKNRKTIYIAKELQDTMADIVMSMRNRDMTIGIYVENIILHHLDTYKDEINRLAEMKFKKLL